MLKVTINGLFVSMRMQGIVRYATELLKALDGVLEADDDVELAVPRQSLMPFDLSHIRIVEVGHLKGRLWEQVDLAAYMLPRKDRLLLNLCNVVPLVARPGITTIHDVMYRANPQDYQSLRNKVSALWHRLQYRIISKREKCILTVSNFSKAEIERYYPRAKGKVQVVPNAWQHVLSYTETPNWRENYPQLVPGEYLFSMATLSRNKNGKWVYEIARRNPELVFAMAGKRYESDEIERPSNVHLLGYISDEDACALIKHCKAFLFPSFYEGFGLPPLEALALGAEVVCSNTTSLPEVLGMSAHYVDPWDFDVDIDNLLRIPVGNADVELARYSWVESARGLYGHLRTIKGSNQ